MKKWAIITKIYGYEPWSDELTEGMLVKVLSEYDNGVCECTAMGVNRLIGDFKGYNGSYDTIIHLSQLDVIRESYSEGFSGFIFENGDWIECGDCTHRYVLRYLDKINYKRNDNVIHFSSGAEEFALPHAINPVMKESIQIISEYLHPEQIEMLNMWISRRE